jgi:uncharacterized damage-inducible protein DinB
MTPGEREVVLKSLTDSREQLHRMGAGLSRDQWHYRAEPGRWSVAECVEHITTVEWGVLTLIEKTLESGPDSSKNNAMKDDALVADVAGRVTRFQAPEMLVPTGRWTHEELLNEFDRVRQRTHDFAASTNSDLRQHFFKHPVLGELDLYQWLLLVAAHCDRHRVQSEEVMATAGYPHTAQTSASA